MKYRPWSLQRRLTLGLTAWSSAIVLLVALVGVAFVEITAQREISDLLNEEPEELRSYFLSTQGTPAEFAEIVDELSRLHPRFQLAWRAWDAETGALWGEFGATALFALSVLGDLNAGDAITSMPGWMRTATADLSTADPPLSLLLVVDARDDLRATRRLQLAVLGAALVASMVSWGVATLIGRYVSGLLKRVTTTVRDIGTDSPIDRAELAPVEQAPAEILAVSRALSELLAKIRAEQEHTRLMTTGLAHELRSPVQNLVGATEVALLSEREPATYRELLKGHLEDLRELATAIDNLVVLCATHGSGNGNDVERFDLAAEVELRMANAASQASRDDVEIVMQARGDLEIQGDREALLLAIRNVVGNAITWSPPNGKVSIALEGGPRSVRVQVEDEGPGIAPEERDYVFEPFRRGRPHPEGRSGYGLGLALTRKAVEAHGGAVEIEASPLRGACLRLTLPRIEGPAQEAKTDLG